MQCKVDGCGRAAMYRVQAVCQKHYFRFMRNGTYSLVGPRDRHGNPVVRQARRSNAKGYVMLYEPTHPLAMKDGYVYEHRKIVFDRDGQNLPACEICAAPTSWDSCHIDHRDEVVTNNEPANLRPLCRGCNTSRTERATIIKYEHGGRLMSLAQWAKEPGVAVGLPHLRRRIKAGMAIGDALYAKNKTHPRGPQA